MASPITTIIDITSDSSFDASKEVLTAKYTDAGNWAEWAAGLLTTDITDITTLLHADSLDADIASLITEIGDIVDSHPGTISGGDGDFTAVNDSLTALQTRLAADITTQHTGLGSTVETALFARETARENAMRAVAYTEVTTQVSAAGFDIPPGALTAKQTEMNNESSLRLTDVNTSIGDTSAKLAVDYNKAMLADAIQLQQILATVFDSKEMRAFEASKATVMLALEAYKTTLGLYSTKAEIILKKGELIIGARARQLQIEVSVLQGLAQSAAQMVAASLNGVSVSSTFGWSAGASSNDSTSESINHNLTA
jgi:hypothetical protein